MELLPVELLRRVFKHLPQSDLLVATQVSRKFCETIENFGLIKRIFIGEDCESSYLVRKYTEAIVKRYSPDVNEKVFDKTGTQLQMLKFAHCSLNLVDILKVLQLASNVKSVTFSYVKLNDDTIDNSVDLPQLNDVDLLFEESSPEIFNLFSKSSFNRIDLRFFADVPYSNFAPLVNLLKTQDKLSSLAFSGIYESNLFLIPMGKANYRLKEFSINNCDIEEWDGLESFLVDHLGTLEKFTVQNLRWDPSSSLNHCTKLKTLHISQTELNFLGKLDSIEELSVEPPIRTMDSFPNTERLFLARSTLQINGIVSSSMGKIEDLEIKFSEVAGIQLPALKKLKLSSTNGIISQEFFLFHNKIEELTFEYCFENDDNLLETIGTSLISLKVLRIFGDNHLTSRAFDIIKDNFKNLKVFEMSKWDQKFKKEDWIKLHEMSGLKVYTEKF